MPVVHRAAFSKRENDWKYINVGLINRWEIQRTPALASVEVKINDVVIKPSSITDSHFIYDFEVLRKQWYDLVGNDKEECNLIALEDACFYAQLQAINHYGKYTTQEELRKSVFTADLVIYIRPSWVRGQVPQDRVEIDEYYLTSDVHEETYNK